MQNTKPKTDYDILFSKSKYNWFPTHQELNEYFYNIKSDLHELFIELEKSGKYSFNRQTINIYRIKFNSELETISAEYSGPVIFESIFDLNETLDRLDRQYGKNPKMINLEIRICGY